MSTLAQQVEEQQKIIQFLQSKFEKETGRKISLPTTVGKLLNDDSIISQEDKKPSPKSESQKDKLSPLTFNEAIENLKLPSGEPPKRGERSKKITLSVDLQKLQKIDLSGFKDKRFSRSGLKELLNGIQSLPCIRSLSLRKNGITDEYQKEVIDIFSNEKIICVDLSHNAMKELGAAIGRRLNEISHIQWLDLTQNNFYEDNKTNKSIIEGFKKQVSLIYVGLTVKQDMSDQLAKLIKAKNPSNSFNLNMRNTELNKEAMNHIIRSVSGPEFYLTGLCLKFCYLTGEQLFDLAAALRYNKTLVKLDLSNNGMVYYHARYILEALCDNTALSEISFSGNFLDDMFGKDLAITLEKNQILFKIDISKNPIGPVGAQHIMQSLLMYNETLGDLGDLSENMYMGVRIREELRQALMLNTSSHDRKRAINKQIQEETKQNYIYEKQTDNPQHAMEQRAKIKAPVSEQMKYPLLKPVTFTNQIEDDYLNSGVWCLKR